MSDKLFTTCKSCNGEIEIVNHKHNLVKCKACTFVFSKTIFTNKEFETVYNELYNKAKSPAYYKHSVTEYEAVKNGIFKIGYNRKRILNKHIKPTDEILEIGSGIGLVGAYLKHIGINKYTGVEIDETSNKKAREFQLNAINGDFKLMGTLDLEADVIMLWEVLEHIQEIDEFFKLSKARLKTGGKLIVSVPNYNKRLNYKNPGDKIFQSGPPIHLNYFTKESVKTVFEQNGFKVQSINTKRFPYLNYRKLSYYKSILKSLFGMYHGSTLYVIAHKIE